VGRTGSIFLKVSFSALPPVVFAPITCAPARIARRAKTCPNSFSGKKNRKVPNQGVVGGIHENPVSWQAPVIWTVSMVGARVSRYQKQAPKSSLVLVSDVGSHRPRRTSFPDRPRASMLPPTACPSTHHSTLRSSTSWWSSIPARRHFPPTLFFCPNSLKKKRNPSVLIGMVRAPKVRGRPAQFADREVMRSDFVCAERIRFTCQENRRRQAIRGRSKV